MEVDNQYEHLTESYVKLAREARALIENAELDSENPERATVSVAKLNRLTRELKGEPQPQRCQWMSVS
jgi:hypothetical protein